MKVLHVIPSVATARGGPSFAIRELTTGLSAAGITVHRASTNDNGPGLIDVPLNTPVDEKGVECYYFARQLRFYTVSLPFHRWICRNVKNYDLVHIHAMFSYCSNVAAMEAARQNVPFIVRPLGVLNQWGMKNRRPGLKQLSLQFIEKRLIARAALMHYTSEQERIEASWIGVNQRSAIISNAVDIPEHPQRHAGQLQKQFPQLNGKRIVLFLSRIDRKKGLDLLIAALPAILRNEPNAILVIAGNGDPTLVSELRVQASTLGVGESIVWAGFLEGEQKAAALASSDLFVLPSYSENFGIAVAEALAYGLPVVTTDQVAVHREVSLARAGIVTACNAEQVADAITSILQSDSTRHTFASNARHLAEECFSKSAMIRAVSNMYDSVLS